MMLPTTHREIFWHDSRETGLTNGTSLRAWVNMTPHALREHLIAVLGVDPPNVAEPECGDGYEEVFAYVGTFRDEIFVLYDRWGMPRIGGRHTLDVRGLIAVLRLEPVVQGVME